MFGEQGGSLFAHDALEEPARRSRPEVVQQHVSGTTEVPLPDQGFDRIKDRPRRYFLEDGMGVAIHSSDDTRPFQPLRHLLPAATGELGGPHA